MCYSTRIRQAPAADTHVHTRAHADTPRASSTLNLLPLSLGYDDCKLTQPLLKDTEFPAVNILVGFSTKVIPP